MSQTLFDELLALVEEHRANDWCEDAANFDYMKACHSSEDARFYAQVDLLKAKSQLLLTAENAERLKEFAPGITEEYMLQKYHEHLKGMFGGISDTTLVAMLEVQLGVPEAAHILATRRDEARRRGLIP